jgi:hypothetical protein
MSIGQLHTSTEFKSPIFKDSMLPLCLATLDVIGFRDLDSIQVS